MDEKIWNTLPEVRGIRMTFGSHRDTDEHFSEPQKSAPYGIWHTETEFTWDDVRFTVKREWFGAPRNPHLFVYRQTVEPFADCDFDAESRIDLPEEGSPWKAEKYLDREDNSCGLLLRHTESGHLGVLCETSQITSFSIRVNETRDQILRTYHITAFEESPIRMEKYVSFHTDEEEDYEELAFRECRDASRIRFDDLKGVGAWDYPRVI